MCEGFPVVNFTVCDEDAVAVERLRYGINNCVQRMAERVVIVRRNMRCLMVLASMF